MRFKTEIRLRLILNALVVLLISGSCFAGAGQKTVSVLFVGNSYTYYHSMPYMFETLSESQLDDRVVEAKFIGGGGATLKKHWQVGEALNEIQTGRWDFVVLQGQSMFGSADLAAPDSPNQFFKYARIFVHEIEANGAEPVFFMTWSRKDRPDQQKYLTKAYTTIALELGARIAPVGVVWDKLRENKKVELYMKDGSHPSVSGSFAAALTLFGAIFDVAPANVPGDLSGYEILRGGKRSEKKQFLCHLSGEQVREIRHAAISALDQAD